jgi:hypothetical protein
MNEFKNVKIGYLCIDKSINSFKKDKKFQINKNYVCKIDSLTNNNDKNEKKEKNKPPTNTYKTFSEISTNQNDLQKNETTHSTVKNYNNECNNDKDNNDKDNNFLVIEETLNTYRLNQSNKSTTIKENGIFNGNVLFFDVNGLKYGLRGKKDGYGFFGTSTHYHGKIINDFVLNINDDGSHQRSRNSSSGHKSHNNSNNGNCHLINEEKNNNFPIVYFVIYYEKETNKFFLKNVRKINYNNLESFIFSFGIYKRYINNCLKIKDNIIICFDENQNYVLAFQIMNNFILRLYLIRIGNIGSYYYSKNNLIYKTNIENNGVSKIIGNKGNIKIDLQGKNYILKYNKNEECWEIKSNNKKKETFWIMIDKRTELTKENVFKINSQYFKIIYNNALNIGYV